MLTTIIYRNHICANVPVKTLEEMVNAANRMNRHSDVTGILLFNGTHFFQLLEGPEESVNTVTSIFAAIRAIPMWWSCFMTTAHHWFGNAGMELF